MRLAIFGGDARMQGACAAAKQAGFAADLIRSPGDVPHRWEHVDAVMLPWPRSFEEGKLACGEIKREQALSLLPCCRVLLCGGVSAQEMQELQRITGAKTAFDPAQDEGFLLDNAKLTAEGAIHRAMSREGQALCGSTCLITGFGRIAQELTRRLTALEAFVIVCARNEGQMRRAHDMGAHPVPLDGVHAAIRHADVIFNTVPAHVLGKAALDQIREDALVIELASPPYGMNVELARHMGVQVAVEGGLPGRYAPMAAGAALFDALRRALEREESREKEQEEGGNAHG